MCNTCLRPLYGIQQARWISWFEAYVDLHVICIAMIATAMLQDDVNDGLTVNREQRGTQNRSQRNSHVKSLCLKSDSPTLTLCVVLLNRKTATDELDQ